VVTTRAFWQSRPLLAVSAALVVIAAGFAAWTGWSWYDAGHSGSVTGARVRDEVLREGQQAVQNFNTLDYRHLDQGLNLWEESSTGTLRSQIAAGRARFEQQIRKARTVSTATVLDAALTALNRQAGTARIIVALQITVRPQAGAPTTKQSRLEGTLQRTSSGWKLASLGQVPVGTAAPSPGPSPSG
jgi:Mce-associated membrane protein